MSTAAIPGASVHRLSRVALLLLLALFLAATALSLRGPYPPFEDDSYIFLRYSRNIAAGAGPVWNVGDAPVEGYTSVLYQALLTLAELLGWSAIARGGWIGIGLSLLALVMTWRLAERVNPSRPLLNLLPPLLLALSDEFQYWTTAGMETPLTILLLVAAALVTLNWFEGQGRAWPVGLVWSLAALARPEALLLFGLTVVLVIGGRLARRQKAATDLPLIVGVFLAVQLPYLIWRWFTFGYLFPNTYYAKTGGGLVQLRGGLDYVLTAGPRLFEVGLLSERWPVLATLLPLVVVVLIVLGLALRPRRPAAYAYLVGLLLVSLLVVIYNGGDHFFRARFIVPLLPFVAVLLAAALDSFLSRPATRPLAAAAALVVALLLAGWGLETGNKVRLDWADARLPVDRVVPPAGGTTLTTLDLWGVGFILMGQKLAEIATPDQSVAVVPIGSIGYFSGIRVLDMVGIVDPVIAHQPMDPAYTASWRPGHDKGDGAHILSLEPDFLQLIDRLTSQPHPGPDELSLRYKSIVELLELSEFQELYEFCAIPMPNGWYYNLYRRRATTRPCESLSPPAAATGGRPVAGVVE